MIISGDRKFCKIDQEIEIGIFQEIETFCKIDQEIEKALGGNHFNLP